MSKEKTRHHARHGGLDGILAGSGRSLDTGSLEQTLSLKHGKNAAELIGCITSKPFGDLLGRPGKRIRGRLVEIGYELAAGAAPSGADADRCKRLTDAIEALHAGSLAIDDLQDGSKMRRGAPCLHVKYGLPIAVTVGNLLYYWPPETIAALGLDPARELRLHRLYHRTMVRAHFGQAMDVGTPIDTINQEQVADVCLSTMELKSGALFALSLLFGAITGGADEPTCDSISEFGHGFGCGLQMFDDIGNVRGVSEPAKRWEDLLLRRPTWIWACAARHYSRGSYAQFVSAVHQLSADDRHPLETWFEQHDFLRRATRLAHDHVEHVFAALEKRIDASRHPALTRLRALGAEIARAYE